MIAVVRVRSKGGALDAGNPEELFPVVSANAGTFFDVTADGKRFVVVVPLTTDNSEPLTLVENWQSGLR